MQRRWFLPFLSHRHSCIRLSALLELGTVPGRFVGQAAIGLTVAACCVLSVARYEGRLSVRNELEQLFLISGISLVLTQ